MNPVAAASLSFPPDLFVRAPARLPADLPMARPIEEIPPVALPSTVAPSAPSSPGFGQMLEGLVREVNSKQVAAEASVSGLLSGQGTTLHQAMIALEEASVAFWRLLRKTPVEQISLSQPLDEPTRPRQQLTPGEDSGGPDRDLLQPAQLELVGRAREALALYRKNQDLITISAYPPGSNPRIDRAIRCQDTLGRFLRQPVGSELAGAHWPAGRLALGLCCGRFMAWTVLGLPMR